MMNIIERFNPLKKNRQYVRRRVILKEGFTLIEIMVAVAILAFGIVAIYEAFFISLDSYGFYANYLNSREWMNERIWEISDDLIRAEMLIPGQTAGRIASNNKDINWTVSIKPMDAQENLYSLDINLNWQQGNRKIKFSRVAYALPHYIIPDDQ
jgi:prepilin-type N-terminal cleavage/methylation domain-containing protein